MRASIDEGIVLNLVTLMEVAHYFRSLPKDSFRKKLRIIQNLVTLTLVDLDRDLAETAFEQFIEYARIGIGGRDSVILATMRVTATRKITTHDEVFKRIEGLEVIDPIPPTR